jgi:hypothetical protein
MSSVDLNVASAARQMEKCDECRKENVKQKVCSTFPDRRSIVSRLQSQTLTPFGTSVHQSVVSGLIKSAIVVFKKTCRVDQTLGAANAPGGWQQKLARTQT